MGIKRNILFGWIALEIVLLPASIPAAAQIMDRVKLSFPARAAFVESVNTPGHKQFIVASNAPFVVISDGAVGEIKIDITVSGTVNGNPHGIRAQAPGALSACALSVSAAPSILYTADRKTAANRGMVIEQAVKIDVKYDTALVPNIRIATLDAAKEDGILTAQICAQGNA
jgi:hypothetical protein